MNTIGDWVEGSLANAKIEGFIQNESYSEYFIIVKKITPDNPKERLPQRLTIGSIHALPKRVIHECYLTFNKDQQETYKEFLLDMKQFDWLKEVQDKFFNPFDSTQTIYSKLYHRTIQLVKTTKEKLFRLYLKSVSFGFAERLHTPEDIKDTESLDYVLSTISLTHDKENIDFIDKITRK